MNDNKIAIICVACILIIIYILMFPNAGNESTNSVMEEPIENTDFPLYRYSSGTISICYSDDNCTEVECVGSDDCDKRVMIGRHHDTLTTGICIDNICINRIDECIHAAKTDHKMDNPICSVQEESCTCINYIPSYTTEKIYNYSKKKFYHQAEYGQRVQFYLLD